jgi:hypothetical protein
MGDESIQRAAQEYLAERLSADGLTGEQRLHRDAAIAYAPAVWQKLIATVKAMCDEWNAETRENTFSSKETILGDLRVRCAGRPHHLISISNRNYAWSAWKTLLARNTRRQARFMRNNEPVDLHMRLLRQFRILAGLRGRAEG